MAGTVNVAVGLNVLTEAYNCFQNYDNETVYAAAPACVRAIPRKECPWRVYVIYVYLCVPGVVSRHVCRGGGSCSDKEVSLTGRPEFVCYVIMCIQAID